jgi:hypothetical protein
VEGPGVALGDMGALGERIGRGEMGEVDAHMICPGYDIQVYASHV